VWAKSRLSPWDAVVLYVLVQKVGPRILIVDDEQGIRRLLKTVFTRAGYEVEVAADGSEAIALCKSQAFDALLSDVRMPGMNGHELARWVAIRHPNTRTVLMSAFDDIQCQSCGMSAEPCWLLAKPFNPNEAVALVGKILTPRRQHPSS
jgi:DNA-binding NtrC family response regulator